MELDAFKTAGMSPPLASATTPSDGTTCQRCREPRWPFGRWEEPYLCQRCREVLAGGNARDPATEAQQRAWLEGGLGIPVTENAAERAQEPVSSHPCTGIATHGSEPSSAPAGSGTSSTIIRHGRAGKPGRPRVPAEVQRQKARERVRAYRARRKAQQSNPTPGR